MSKVRGRNTGPEKLLRSFLHRKGFRFRVCCRELPGSPDIVLKKYGAALFVHGCFWHQHKRCGQKRIPRTNRAYWKGKFMENRLRDRRKLRALRKAGWRVLTVWECQLRTMERLGMKIEAFLMARP